MPVLSALRRKPKSKIKKSARAVKEAASAKPKAPKKPRHPGKLKAKRGWDFVTKIVVPAMFQKRAGATLSPDLTKPREWDLNVTWIGHASFLIQTSGRNLLVDPNWATWIKGIKRVRHAGLHPDALPPIDLVLVTHAHFDHLDRRSLRRVAADQPIVVPHEVGNLVHDLGFRTVHELHHWEKYVAEPLRVTHTPCRHWGARMLRDSHRGYGGYVIEAAGRRIFHCGDTAYFDGFREIKKKVKKLDVALLPIGAYDPPSQSKEVHMTPEEAVKAFQELGAEWLVPMHYGSFRLSFEPLDEPLERLLIAADKAGLADRVRVLREGEPVSF